MTCTLVVLLLGPLLVCATAPAGLPSKCPIYSYEDATLETCDPCSGRGSFTSVASMTETSPGFPAYGLNPSDPTQLEVTINPVFIRLDAVDVAAGDWTVRMQVDMYWWRCVLEVSSREGQS